MDDKKISLESLHGNKLTLKEKLKIVFDDVVEVLKYGNFKFTSIETFDINIGTDFDNIINYNNSYFFRMCNEDEYDFTPNFKRRLLKYNNKIFMSEHFGSTFENIKDLYNNIRKEIIFNDKLHPPITNQLKLHKNEELYNLHLSHTNIRANIGNLEQIKTSRVLYYSIIKTIGNKKHGIILFVDHYHEKNNEYGRSIPNKENFDFIKEGIDEYLKLPENKNISLNDFAQYDSK